MNAASHCRADRPLDGARVVLGVSGGIAAYKAVLLCRLLIGAGAHVVPVMTKAAQRFVGRATFDALASEPVRMSVFGEDDPIPHTTLGQHADLVVVAPATARLIGSYAAGISDGLLTATLLATAAPVLVCPAMHTEMWEHPAVQANLATLRSRGVHVASPTAGRLAGGDSGTGRLAEPEVILAAAVRVLRPPQGDLAGTRVVVTAGGTREAIDPVRFIGNRSTGKQGYAVAEAARDRGAAVTLITAAALAPPTGMSVVEVESAAQMADAVTAHADADLIVMAAAVADFRPVAVSGQKIKKHGTVPAITLEATPDILAGLGAAKRAGQVLVGFAAETADVIAHAADKLRRKRLDVIVANDVTAAGAGFAHDTNEVAILTPGASGVDVRRLSLRSKRAVAEAVLDAAVAARRHDHDASTVPSAGCSAAADRADGSAQAAQSEQPVQSRRAVPDEIDDRPVIDHTPF